MQQQAKKKKKKNFCSAHRSLVQLGAATKQRLKHTFGNIFPEVREH